jgi:hypothetical protein
MPEEFPVPEIDPVLEKELRQKARELVTTDEIKKRAAEQAKENMRKIYNLLFPKSSEYKEKYQQEYNVLLEAEIGALAEEKFWELVQSSRE